MRAVRERVDKHRKKIPVAVMVGHPWHYRGMMDPIDGNFRGLLLDVSTWADEGLMDSAIAAGYYRPGGELPEVGGAERPPRAADAWDVVIASRNAHRPTARYCPLPLLQAA